jgi:hypothetical protein
MTARIAILIVFAAALSTARAVDLDKLPPMNETKQSADIELKAASLKRLR